jgi:hypothetical protein
MAINPSVYKRVIESFEALERDGFVKKIPLRTIYGTDNSLLVTAPHQDEVPVRSKMPLGQCATRNDLNREFSKR